MDLRIAAPHLADLHRRVLSHAPEEGAAFLAVEPAGQRRLVVRWCRVFEREELETGVRGELVLSEQAQVAALAAVKREGHAAVEVHTHPGSGSKVGFSPFDEEQLPAFARYVRHKLPGRPFGALVLGERGYAGRIFTDSGTEPLVLTAAGERGAVPGWLGDPAPGPTPEPPVDLGSRFDRQVRALGIEGQQAIAALRVGVVGLGGTGSQVVQQLAHLGVRSFVLVDDDRVETSNLHRLAGAAWWDSLLRRRKDAVAARLVRRVLRRAEILKTGTLRCRASLDALAGVDLVIGCLDNDGARLVLSELAAAHLVPYLDIGVGIEGEGKMEGEQGPASMGGRVSFALPGGPCLACADELDFGEAAEDLEGEQLRAIRAERGYAHDRRVEPALMPLNTVLAGLAMIEFLAFATATRPVIPFQRYDALGGRVVVQRVVLEPDCPVCRPAFGMGDRQEMKRYALDLTRSG